jgi:hypothetical protein
LVKQNTLKAVCVRWFKMRSSSCSTSGTIAFTLNDMNFIWYRYERFNISVNQNQFCQTLFLSKYSFLLYHSYNMCRSVASDESLTLENIPITMGWTLQCITLVIVWMNVNIGSFFNSYRYIYKIVKGQSDNLL